MIIMIFSSWAVLIKFDINPIIVSIAVAVLPGQQHSPETTWTFLSNYCYSFYHNILNVINCSVFLFIFRHGPLTRQRNSPETRDCFEVLSESFCEGRYSEMSSEARHFCVAARVIPRNDFCSGAATDACPSKSMHPWLHHNPRAYNLPMECIEQYSSVLVLSF